MNIQDLPSYQCHKVVKAAKITGIEKCEENTELVSIWVAIPNRKLPSEIRVDMGYYVKHKPKVGGYIVLYDDNYQSYSPADAFENGYTKIK